MRGKFLTDQKFIDELSKYKYTCSCGHTLVILRPKTKKLCKWCGHYVYVNEKEKEKEEFKKKMKGLLK